MVVLLLNHVKDFVRYKQWVKSQYLTSDHSKGIVVKAY